MLQTLDNIVTFADDTKYYSGKITSQNDTTKLHRHAVDTATFCRQYRVSVMRNTAIFCGILQYFAEQTWDITYGTCSNFPSSKPL